MEGKIKKVLDKNSNIGKPFKSILVDDEWFNCWSESINKILVEGEIIKFEYEQNGQFKNLTKLFSNEKVEEILISDKKVQENTQHQKWCNDKDVRITRMACLNTATELYKVQQNKIGDNEVLNCIKRMAEELEKWITR